MLAAALFFAAVAAARPLRAADEAADPAAQRIAREFTVVARLAGYQEPAAFLVFLDDARQGRAPVPDPLAELFERNRFLFVLAVLGGGLLLNLTPCVLPMIPINLGIIGAGVQAASRRRGFLLGGAYGLGTTVAYGALGLLSVVTGAAFGLLQSSPWFNAAIAVAFVVLALALFDVLLIDLSRFQHTGRPSRAGSFGAAFGIGAVSALLAGACVAPVLISTLMLSASLHQRGHAVGLLLPFLLGLGMALPWPFAGAGLSFLPRPGAWMSRVKQAFGILVLLFALHYGRLAARGFSASAPQASPPPHTPPAAAEAQFPRADGPGTVPWRSDLDEALAESLRTGKPVMADLWATWCTACLRMERTTLRDPRVAAELAAAFIPVKVQCERPAEPETAARMQAFGAGGLPTFVILRPKRSP